MGQILRHGLHRYDSDLEEGDTVVKNERWRKIVMRPANRGVLYRQTSEYVRNGSRNLTGTGIPFTEIASRCWTDPQSQVPPGKHQANGLHCGADAVSYITENQMYRPLFPSTWQLTSCYLPPFQASICPTWRRCF